jgi:hypothetical protein
MPLWAPSKESLSASPSSKISSSLVKATFTLLGEGIANFYQKITISGRPRKIGLNSNDKKYIFFLSFASLIFEAVTMAQVPLLSNSYRPSRNLPQQTTDLSPREDFSH